MAETLTAEIGAPAKFARGLQWSIGYLHLQTGIARLKDYRSGHAQGSRTIVRREPIGVIGMITPWNWPIDQILVKVVPALATCCTSVVARRAADAVKRVHQELGGKSPNVVLDDADGKSLPTDDERWANLPRSGASARSSEKNEDGSGDRQAGSCIRDIW